MKPKVYLETSVISYLTSRPSRDVIVAAHQLITRDWWEKRRQEFDIFASQIVLDEAAAGDKTAASRRLEALEQVIVLEVPEVAKFLASELIQQVPVPSKAAADAFHIAVAVVSGMEYLLTWNCTHLANAALRDRIESVCHARGFEVPVICTPEGLLGEHGYVEGPDR